MSKKPESKKSQDKNKTKPKNSRNRVKEILKEKVIFINIYIKIFF